jgi:2-methylisocitrate lyase-like PEP mutase family enzyme
MDVQSLRAKADRLRALHHGPRPLVLVNAWDCATARIFEQAGSPAIATTSAGIAFACGYPDGQRIPVDLMLEAVARICRAVSVPVTADLEAGYGDSPETLARTVSGMLEAGAVGLNLEDHAGQPSDPLTPLPLQLDKIRAIKEAAESHGIPVVLNARTDPFLRGIGDKSEMFEEALLRGEAYRDAGADCVFVPGLADGPSIGEIIRRLGCPVNVLAGAASPSIDELARLGVARVSLGSGPMRAAMSLLQRLAEEVLTRGTYSSLDGIVSHARMNELMESPGRS